MGKLRIKQNYRRRVLRLPDLDHCKLAVLNSLGSPASRRVFRRLLKHIARDLEQAEEILRNSGLDWTIVRPPRLTNGSNERYRIAENALPEKGFSASFRAVAAFMLDATEQRSHVHEIVGLAKT